MIKDMSGFRYISLASIVALVYTGIVLLIELPDYAKANYSSERCNAFIIDMGIFKSAAITFFAYAC